MSTTLAAERGRVSTPRALTIGIVGGIAFGMLMAMQDMLPMVAALVGSDPPSACRPGGRGTSAGRRDRRA